MLNSYSEQLVEIKEKLRLKTKWENQLETVTNQLTREEKKLQELKRAFSSEEEDVRRLEDTSLHNFFYTLIGSKEEKLSKEKEELLAVKIKLDECQELINDLTNERQELWRQLKTVEFAEKEYKDILEKKEQFLRDNNSSFNEEMARLAETEANLKAEINEYSEAIDAAVNVKSSMENLITSLGKAEGWGTMDMFGGGMISTSIKHGYIDDAKSANVRAQRDMTKLQTELADLNRQVTGADIEIGTMLTFADYLFDGFFVDWMVNNKISQALEQARHAKQTIVTLESDLSVKRALKQTELELNHERKTKLIETTEV